MIDSTRTRASLAVLIAVTVGAVTALAMTGEARADIAGSTYSTGNSPVQAAVTPDGKTLLVADGGSGDIVTDVDLTDGTTKTITVGSNPNAVALSPDGRTAVVTDSGSGEVSVLDLTYPTPQVVHTVSVDGTPQDVTISPNGVIAYVSCGVGKIDVVYLPTGSVLQRLTAGSDPQGLALSPDGRYLYVAQVGGVLRYDLEETSGTTQPWTSGTDTLSDIAISPDGTQAYVTDFSADEVGVLNLGNFGHAGPVEVTSAGFGPVSVSTSPDGSILYIADNRAYNSGDEAYDGITEVVPGTDLRRNLNVVGKFVRDVAVSPNGAEIYAVMNGSNQIDAFQTQPLSDAPTIAGTAAVGQTLGLQPLWSRAPSTMTSSYQWYSDGHPVGADRPTYKIPASALGKAVSVTVTETIPGGEPLQVTSAATGAVVEGTLATVRPRITGTHRVGKVLTAVPGTWTPKPSYSYRWFAGGKRIHAATKKTWRVTSAARGKKVTVKVTGKKPGYRSVTVASKTVRIP